MTRIQAYLATNPSFQAASVGYLVKDDDVLLGRRKRVSLGLGEHLIAGIGGKCEAHETAAQALMRECEEEIGVRITEYMQVGMALYCYPDNAEWNQHVTIFLVTGWQGVPQETDSIQPL